MCTGPIHSEYTNNQRNHHFVENEYCEHQSSGNQCVMKINIQ
jgi:hypothetical protein